MVPRSVWPPTTLSEQSYPVPKDDDWLPNSSIKPRPDTSADKRLNATDKPIKDVAQKNRGASAGALATVPTGGEIGVAAKTLSEHSHPFKDGDWLPDVFSQPLPDTSPDKLKPGAIAKQLDTTPRRTCTRSSG